MLAWLPLLALAGAPNVDGIYPDLQALYRDLHAHPELSNQEVETAAKLAARLKDLGYEVTEKVGGNGLVAVLRNGSGPTVMLRTDLDGLPVLEKTGLPYASQATGTGPDGNTVPVMHACGHDVHMTAWIGAATLLAADRKAWRGTLVLIGQPAEELGSGAKAMLDDGLFSRFPKPDVALAIHDSNKFPAGTVAMVPGFAMANVDSVDLTLYGKGGHGAQPQTTVDPIVMAAKTVVSLQTLVARETDPLKPSVVTVGAFHAGTKHNIIADEAHLQITVRSYDDKVRQDLLDGIRRIALAEAQGARAPKDPLVVVTPGPGATWNAPALGLKLRPVLEKALGKARVLDGTPIMGAEDFSEFGRAGVPAWLLWVGASPADQPDPPSTHSPFFAPVEEPTLKTAVTALVAMAHEAFRK